MLGIDLPAVLTRLNGNQELLVRLLTLFADQCRDLVPRMNQALEVGDAATAQRLSHSLKGTAGNLCATQIQRSAAILDGLLRESTDQARIDACLETLAQQLEPLVSAIDRNPDQRATEAEGQGGRH